MSSRGPCALSRARPPYDSRERARSGGDLRCDGLDCLRRALRGAGGDGSDGAVDEDVFYGSGALAAGLDESADYAASGVGGGGEGGGDHAADAAACSRGADAAVVVDLAVIEVLAEGLAAGAHRGADESAGDDVPEMAVAVGGDERRLIGVGVGVRRSEVRRD